MTHHSDHTTDTRPPTHDAAPVKTPTEARQGFKGVPVLWVLIGGLVLAGIALILLMTFTSISAPPPTIGATPDVGPSSDATPGNAEPSRLDAPPPPGQ